MKILGMCLTYVKGIFSRNIEMFFSLMIKLVRFSRFGECPFGRDLRSLLTTTSFQIFFCYESWKYMSTLRRKVFSGGTSEKFSSLGLKFLRFSCFQECRFGRDQRSQLNSDRHLFKKDFCCGSYKYVSTLRKKIFSVAEVKFFLL